MPIALTELGRETRIDRVSPILDTELTIHETAVVTLPVTVLRT
jgi:hypothetical protein